MNIDELRNQIKVEFNHVWQLNDEAHRSLHFENVYRTGCLINLELQLGYDPKLILFAAYFHDMFAWSRNNHHEMAYHWLTTTDHQVILGNLTSSETMLVAWACMQHRASFQGAFKGNFSELINSADRGYPGDVQYMLDRALQYREKKYPRMSADERMAGAIAHLKEKYAEGGYARYPEMYLRVFGDKLEQQRIDIGKL